MGAAAEKKTLGKKGIATRERIKLATIKALNEMSYNQLTIAGIAKRAGVANGLFYHYFPNVQALVMELIDEQMQRFEAAHIIEQNAQTRSWFSYLRAHYQGAVKAYASQPGLMRCIKQFSLEDDAFRSRWQESHAHRLNRLIKQFPQLVKLNPLPEKYIYLLTHALSGIGVNLLESYYIEQNESLTQLDLQQDEMAEWLSVLFYRGMFAANPAEGDLQYASALLTLEMDEKYL